MQNVVAKTYSNKIFRIHRFEYFYYCHYWDLGIL